MAISINRCVVTKAGNTITYGDTSERRDLGGKTMAQSVKPSSYEEAIKNMMRGDGFITTTRPDTSLAITVKNATGLLASMRRLPNIKNVIFNPPATVVYFEDGTKTVVKCQEGDEFDAEKGLAMAVAKRAYGNKGNYCNQMKKWVEEWNEEQARIDAREKENHALDAAMKRFVRDSEETKPWRVWWVRYNPKREIIERGVRGKYLTEEPACELYNQFCEWNRDCWVVISPIDPWADDTLVSAVPLRDFDEDMEFVAAKSNELKLKADDHKPWRIWYRQIDPSTLKAIGSGVDLQTYNTFDEAVKAAHAKYMYNDEYHFWISRNNPWTGADK